MAEDFEKPEDNQGENERRAGEAPAAEPSGAPEDGPRASIQQDFSAMRMVLRKTGRAWRRPILVEGSLWYLITLGAVGLSALLVAALVPAAVPEVTGWMLIIGAGAATLGALAAWIGFRAGTKDVEEIARRLQREHPAFRNDIVAALEFAEKLLNTPEHQPLGFSRQMARAHVRRTTREMLQKCEHSHLAHLLTRRELTAPAVSLAGCVVLLLIPFLIDSAWARAVLTSPFAGVEATRAKEVTQRPIVGALNIFYSAPSYTGLGRTVDRHSSGYVEALVGTEVMLEAVPLLRDVARIELVLKTEDSQSGDSKSGEKVLLMREHQPEPDPFARSFGFPERSTLRASFVAMEPGHYHFRAILADGTVVEEGVERKINLVPDESPEILVPTHAGEVDVSPDDVLDIGFEISDDFGVESVWQVWHFAGDPENQTRTKIDLPQLANAPRETRGEIQFDLHPLSLQSKDQVVFYFEGIDNNSMTGPGVGRSKPILLRVASPEDKHHQNIQAQEAILDAMIELLAGYLENPMGEHEPRAQNGWGQAVDSMADPAELLTRLKRLSKLQPHQVQLVEAMQKVAADLKKDPLVIERNLTLFTALHDELADLNAESERVFTWAKKSVTPPNFPAGPAQRVANYAAQAEDVLERGVLRLGELLASAKMAAVQASVDEINELKERLKTLLKQYKETQDPELKKAILRDVQRLRQRMNELMNRMRAQLQDLPKEHMNSDAIKQQQLESETHKMADSLTQIEDLLENDDIDGALKALEDLETSLDALSSDMDEQFEQAQPQGLSELDKKVDKLMNELNDVRQAEKRLEEDTNKLNKEQAEKRREHIEKMLDAFTDKMLRKVAEQQAALKTMAEQASEMPHQQRIKMNQDAIKGLKKMLEDKDIATSLERARQALRASHETRYSLELSRRYSDSDELKREIDQLRTQNDQVSRRGKEIVDEIEKLMDQAQQKLGQKDNQQMQELAERQEQIAEQAQKLQQQIGKAGEQFPELKEQLGPSMRESQEAMKNAAESLRAQRPQQGLDQERQALDQLGKLQQQMKQVVKKQRQGTREKGPRSAPRDKVAIPGEDNKQSGKQLRQDVMDAMKQEKLERYQSEIERYYKSIME